jgi:hypothetical protein
MYGLQCVKHEVENSKRNVAEGKAFYLLECKVVQSVDHRRFGVTGHLHLYLKALHIVCVYSPFFLGVFFYPEYGGDSLLRNTG